MEADPQTPYYAVIFTSHRSSTDADDGYAAAAAHLEDLVRGRPGYLGMDSVRGPDGLGITVSYWRDEESIAAWRADADHARARRLGREAWYASFTVQVARVERAYRSTGSVPGRGPGAPDAER